MAQVMSKAKTASNKSSVSTAGTGAGSKGGAKASGSKAATQARKVRTTDATTKAATAKATTAKAEAKPAASQSATSKSTTAKPRAASGTSSRKRTPAGKGSRSTAAKATAKKSAAKATGSAHDTLSKSQARLSRKMLDEREKLVRQAEELEAEQAALAADPDAAEMSGDIESGDCVASREREVDLRLSAHIGDMIAQIDRATERLNTGTYGECARCHNRIPAARLEALPYAELCVSCQEKHERLYY